MQGLIRLFVPILLAALMTGAAHAQGKDAAGGAVATVEPAVFSNTVVWVPDVKRAAQFYNRVFGVQTLFQMDLGTHWWLEMSTGGTHLSFASENQATDFTQGKLHRNRPGAVPAALALTFRVKAMEATLQRAKAEGATIVYPPKLQPWGQVEARIRDPNGVLIAVIAPPLKK